MLVTSRHFVSRVCRCNAGGLRRFAASASDDAVESPKKATEIFRPRQEFVLPKKYDFRVWNPQHMRIQMEKMQGKLRTIDLIVEVGVNVAS